MEEEDQDSPRADSAALLEQLLELLPARGGRGAGSPTPGKLGLRVGRGCSCAPTVGAWSSPLVTDKVAAFEGAPRRRYEVQVAATVASTGAAPSSAPARRCVQAWAPVEAASQARSGGLQSFSKPDALVSPSARRFPEMLDAGIKEPRPARPPRAGTKGALAGTPVRLWWELQARETQPRPGALPFKAGAPRPRLLERLSTLSTCEAGTLSGTWGSTSYGSESLALGCSGSLGQSLGSVGRSGEGPRGKPAVAPAPAAAPSRQGVGPGKSPAQAPVVAAAEPAPAAEPAKKNGFKSKAFVGAALATAWVSGLKSAMVAATAPPATAGAAAEVDLPAAAALPSRKGSMVGIAPSATAAAATAHPYSSIGLPLGARQAVPALASKTGVGGGAVGGGLAGGVEELLAASRAGSRLYGKSVLWKVKPMSDRQTRMDRLTMSRREAQDSSDVTQLYRDRVCKRQDVELAQESFHRYFTQKVGNSYSKETLIEALADFGIRASTRPDKLQLNELLSNFQSPTIGFGDFCTLAEEARGRLRHAHTLSVFQAWKRLDADDTGALPPGQAMQFLEDLGLSKAVGSHERALAEAALAELHRDAGGLISFHEAEFAAQQLRQHEQAARRRREREIQAQYSLSPGIFKEFRSQLVDLYTQFKLLDEDDSGTLDVGEVTNLLGEFGCNLTVDDAHVASEVIVSEATGQDITFPEFLSVIRRLRAAAMRSKLEEVVALFNRYDVDKSEELDVKEVCSILVELGLQPKTSLEQDNIAQLIEEVDVDGSGQLNLMELLHMVQRIEERLVQLQRESENQHAVSLGFQPKTTAALRRAHEVLDTSHNGYLGTAEVERAVQLMGWRVTAKKVQRLLEEVDADGSGQLDFKEFLVFMRKVEDEVRGTGPRQLAAAEEVPAKGDVLAMTATIPGPTSFAPEVLASGEAPAVLLGQSTAPGRPEEPGAGAEAGREASAGNPRRQRRRSQHATPTAAQSAALGALGPVAKAVAAQVKAKVSGRGR